MEHICRPADHADGVVTPDRPPAVMALLPIDKILGRQAATARTRSPLVMESLHCLRKTLGPLCSVPSGRCLSAAPNMLWLVPQYLHQTLCFDFTERGTLSLPQSFLRRDATDAEA